MSQRFGLVLIFLLAASGCKLNPPVALKGYVSEGATYRWPSREVAVCWENAALAERSSMRVVEAVVTARFAAVGFHFTGWDQCTPHAAGIHVQMGSDGPAKVLAYGYHLDGLSRGLQLTSTSSYEKTKGLCGSPDVSDCLGADALHQFGHALGLRHDANWGDSSCWNDQSKKPNAAGALAVGTYDKGSVMNRCAESASVAKDQGGLSLGDQQTLEAYYSAAPPDFTHKKACEEDGYSWSEQDLTACCSLKPGGVKPAAGSRGYAFCSDQPKLGGAP